MGKQKLVDPYFKGLGDDAYVVTHFDFTGNYRVGANRLQAEVTYQILIKGETQVLSFDCVGLKVTGVKGKKNVKGFKQTPKKLVVSLTEKVKAGEHFSLQLSYQGNPAMVAFEGEKVGWEELEDGVLVASQPNGTPGWLPCNDVLASLSTYRVSLTVANAYQVIAPGVLVAKKTKGANTTWVWDNQAPSCNYLIAIQVGKYRTDILPGDVPLKIVTPSHGRHRDQALKRFADLPEMMHFFAETFGPYPFPDYTVVVVDEDLEIPIEALAMATFGINHLTTTTAQAWENERLVAHELAHQWFGNKVSLGRWQDIWLNEGFACFSEWLWREHRHGVLTSVEARRYANKVSRGGNTFALGDPQPANLFDDDVYKGGALILQYLRTKLGDQAFFSFLSSWSATAGMRTTTDFLDSLLLAHPDQAVVVSRALSMPVKDLPAALG